MQTVSEGWKNNQKKTLVNESFVEVSLDIADPDAIADAAATDNGAVYISNTPQVVSEVDKSVIPYFTLEQNLWVLDGSRKAIPDNDYGRNGYISDVLSAANGGFDDKLPTITINFTKVHQNIIPAITITWGTAYNEFAEDFIVSVFNGDSLVLQKDVSGNKSVKSVVTADIVNYDRIVIKILRWCLPYRRARIEEIFVGMNKVYSKSELFGFSHSQTIDPLSTSLPKSEISFSIDNTDDTYNPYNTRGMEKYLMSRQEVTTRYGFKLDDGATEWIDGGKFYLSEWDAAQNGITAEFVARDLLEFMSAIYYKGVYKAAGESLYNLATSVFEEADLPLNDDGSVKWKIDEALKNVYTVAPLPVDTLANCLQLVANAGRCVLYQDRKGVFHLERFRLPFILGKTKLGEGYLTKGHDYPVSLDNSYSKSEITLSKPLKQVNVFLYNYFTSDEFELYNGKLYVNGTTDFILTYSSMAVNAVANVSGAVLESVEYYTNACKLTISGDGEATVIINGTKLTEAKSDTNIVSGTSGEIVTLDNPLVTNFSDATAIGRWAMRILQSRVTLTSSWRADPRLDALDVVENINEYAENKMQMTEVKFSYNGAFRGSGKGRVI